MAIARLRASRRGGWQPRSSSRPAFRSGNATIGFVAGDRDASGIHRPETSASPMPPQYSSSICAVIVGRYGEEHAGHRDADLPLDDDAHSVERRAAGIRTSSAAGRPARGPDVEERTAIEAAAGHVRDRVELAGKRGAAANPLRAPNCARSGWPTGKGSGPGRGQPTARTAAGNCGQAQQLSPRPTGCREAFARRARRTPRPSAVSSRARRGSARAPHRSRRTRPAQGDRAG